MILVTKTSDQTRQRGHTLSTCTNLCVCVCVCVVFPFILDVRLVDVPARVTQEEGHTGFLIRLPSAVLALIFLARRIQSFLSLVDRDMVKSNFCVLTDQSFSTWVFFNLV